MFKHVVCFQFHDKAQAPIVREKLLALKGVVPEILDIDVGVNELDSPRSYDMVLILTFKDQAAMEAYDRNPDHLVVREYVLGVRKGSVAVDYNY